MGDSIFALLSAFLGLLLMDAAILVTAPTLRRGAIGALSIEVRYVALLSVILLFALNANQWLAGRQLFPLLCIAAIASILTLNRRLSAADRGTAFRDGILLLLVQTITLLGLFMAFQMPNYLLLEAANHDSLVYYQGMHWATESSQFVGSEAVRAKWGLGACGEGASWVGFNCPLYRGGTYTLTAWMQYFAPRFTGSGLYFIAAYAVTMVWFGIRLLPSSTAMQSTIFVGVLIGLVGGVSTGLLGALVNSNLATVMGGASLAMIVAIALRTDLQPTVRYGLMAAWCAVCAHFYAEAVFYAGLLIALVFLLELRIHTRTLNLLGSIRLAILILIIVFVLGNIAVGQAFSSLLLFKEVATGGEWFSWYIHNLPALWLGSFVGGLLMGSTVVDPIVVLAAVVTLSSVLLFYSRDTRYGILALIGLSALAVVYVEMTGYQYGEHKIVHLLGPSWSLLVLATSLRLMYDGGGYISDRLTLPRRTAAGRGLLLCLIFILGSFAANAVFLLNQWRGPHGLDFGLATLASYVRPGETVLVDDSAWVGVEKFHKGHYLTFQLHHQGAEVLMPDVSDNILRGGYFRDIRNDSLRETGAVDWLIQSQGHAVANSRLGPPTSHPIWENSNYRLYRVSHDPLVVASSGWHDCEPSHCWTAAPFEIETFVPSVGRFELLIDFWVFAPPETGTIRVHTSDGKLLGTTNARSTQLRIVLPNGWARLVIDGDWRISSPLEVGISEDPRNLFAAIQHIQILPSQLQEL